MRDFRLMGARISNRAFASVQARSVLDVTQEIAETVLVRAKDLRPPTDVQGMNVKIETLRQVALASVDQCLDLRRFVPEIALVMQGRVGFDREPGRVIWIVGEQDGDTWAVSMPADRSDVDSLLAVDCQ